MRSIRFFGLVSALVLSAGRPSAASSQDFRAADLRVNMQIRVQQSGGEASSGLFLGILGDTLFYESSTALPANVSGSPLTHSVVKVPITAISRLDVQVGPPPPIARDKCAGVLAGAGCGARIAVEAVNDDMRNGQRHSSSNNSYDGIADAVAVGGLVIGGAVVGLIKSANRHIAVTEDSGWRHVRLPKPQTR
jgi:hypothetical protein